ncbi:MAG: hypothetical protein QOJ29_5 [Thermoleophilaceae bacterium]|nr:hypothetical protein [Thermoleophilaceae bacterium]
MRRLVVIASLAVLIMAAATQSASALVAGIGDQNASTFADANFKKLKVKRTRLIVAWDAINKSSERARLSEWMGAAKAAKLKVLVAFNPSTGSHCPSKPCSVPSPAKYAKAFKAFRKAFPQVKEFNFWNETNSPTQPTGPARKVKAAAKLYLAAKKACRSCTITGPDILDLAFDKKSGQKRVSVWVKTFLHAVGSRNYPKVWGFHNYQSTNYNRPSQTTFFTKKVAKKGQVWVTETGGIVQFKTSTGKATPFEKYDENRAAKAITYAYSIAKKNRRIKRLYYYQWMKNNAGDLFDAGIVNPDGSPRPAYAKLLKLPKSIWK